MNVLKVKDSNLLKQSMAMKGYSQNSLAKTIKTSPTSIGKYLQGKNVRPDKAKKISDLLGYEVSYFFELSGHNNETTQK